MLSFFHSARQPLYKSIEIKEKLWQVYNTKLEQWPVPYETRFVETEYGQIHVIISGPEDAPPVLLLHAASMGAWSWLYNVEALTGDFRTYAVDYIGEPGKSELMDMNKVPADGEALSDLYGHIADELGIAAPYDLVAASFGGYIAVNHALHAPERVGKVVLLGPMGITPATSITNVKLVLYMLFPLKIFHNRMLHWALGDDPRVLAETEEWFRLVLSGITRKGVGPRTFSPEQLQEVRAPLLLILGNRDQLVGDPEKVRPLAEKVPDVRIEVLSSAHLIGAEQPKESNTLIKEFLMK
jgi:pimeloyl-ACP methyl ester carboxylesterase